MTEILSTLMYLILFSHTDLRVFGLVINKQSFLSGSERVREERKGTFNHLNVTNDISALDKRWVSQNGKF